MWLLLMLEEHADQSIHKPIQSPFQEFQQLLDGAHKFLQNV